MTARERKLLSLNERTKVIKVSLTSNALLRMLPGVIQSDFYLLTRNN